jgi:hypothetical protein
MEASARRITWVFVPNDVRPACALAEPSGIGGIAIAEARATAALAAAHRVTGIPVSNPPAPGGLRPHQRRGKDQQTGRPHHLSEE